MKYFGLLIIVVLLTSCVTATPYKIVQPTLPSLSIGPPPPTFSQNLATVLLAPVTIPLAIIVNNPPSRGYRSVHCQSYTYKDAYHTKCY
jgi:hypothetical protein